MQTTLTYIILLAVACLVLRRIIRFLKKPDNGTNCGECNGCVNCPEKEKFNCCSGAKPESGKNYRKKGL